MGILVYEWLRPKCRIVGTIAKIRTKETISYLHGGKANPILIRRRTEKFLNPCGNLSIKRPKKYYADENENKHGWQLSVDIRYGHRFARRSESEIVDDIKSRDIN